MALEVIPNGSVTDELYTALEPLTREDEANGNALKILTASMAGMMQEIDDLARDHGEDPGWSSLMDVAVTPEKSIDWLGQLAGVKPTEGLTADQKRAAVAAHIGFSRGSVAAMRAAAQIFMVGTKTVNFYERDTSPYHLTVQVYGKELPLADRPSFNYFPNSGAETDVAWWNTGGGVFVTRTTADKYAGVASALFSASGAGGYNQSGIIVTGAPVPQLPYTISTRIRALGPTIGKTIRIKIYETGGGPADSVAGQADFVLDGSWQQLWLTATPVSAVRTGLFFGFELLSSAAGDSWLQDEVQFEQQEGPTPVIFTNGAGAGRVSVPGGGIVERALISQKPAGIVMSYIVTVGQTFQALKTNHPLYSQVKSYYSTYDKVRSDVP